MKTLALISLVSILFGGGVGYLGAGWINNIAQLIGTNFVTTRLAEPNHYSQFMFHRGIDQGDNQRHVFDRYEQLYQLELTLSPVTGSTPGTFDQYLLDQPSDLKDIYARGHNILAEVSDSGGFDDLSSSDQSALMFLGSALRYGPRGAQTISDSLGRARENFDLMRLQGTTTETNFLDYLGRQYGLNFEPIGRDARRQVPPTSQPATPTRQPAATPTAWEEARSMMMPNVQRAVGEWIRTGEGLTRIQRTILARIQREQGFEGTLEEYLESLKRGYLESRAVGAR
jgi:hypothetical protein